MGAAIFHLLVAKSQHPSLASPSVDFRVLHTPTSENIKFGENFDMKNSLQLQSTSASGSQRKVWRRIGSLEFGLLLASVFLLLANI